jgi:hypothetical protein
MATLINANYILPLNSNCWPTKDQFECELTQATFTINTNAVNGYQWEVSTNGINGILLQTIQYRSFYEYFKINQLSNGMNGYKYQVVLSKMVIRGRTSNPVNLTVYSLPIVNSPVTLVQVDDTDGISTFNLTKKQ